MTRARAHAHSCSRARAYAYAHTHASKVSSLHARAHAPHLGSPPRPSHGHIQAKAGDVTDMTSSAFASVVDSFRAPWWTVVVLTFVTFLNPHSIFPLVYDTWYWDAGGNGYIRQDATHMIPRVVLTAEAILTGIAMIWAFKRWWQGSNGTNGEFADLPEIDQFDYR